MESKDKVELLQIAIKQLIEEGKANSIKKSSRDEGFVAVGGDDAEPDADGHRLLSKLLSQLEMLKEDGMLELELEVEVEGTKPLTDIDKVDSPEVGEGNESANKKEASPSNSQLGKDEIILQELKQVQRQNFITHCLLSAMIVLTVAWQLSEVSLILKLQEGLSNPLKSLGGLINGMLRLRRPPVTPPQVDKLAACAAMHKPLLAASSLPGLKIPQLPHVHVKLPVFDLDDEED